MSGSTLAIGAFRTSTISCSPSTSNFLPIIPNHKPDSLHMQEQVSVVLKMTYRHLLSVFLQTFLNMASKRFLIRFFQTTIDRNHPMFTPRCSQWLAANGKRTWRQWLLCVTMARICFIDRGAHQTSLTFTRSLPKRWRNLQKSLAV